jgi:hypothetical protein
MRRALTGGAATFAAVALVVAALAAEDDPAPAPVATGTIYSMDAGDPLDVVAASGDVPGTICANVGGFFYDAGISCFDAAAHEGSYQVVLPTDAGRPTMVVGVMPPDARGVTVGGVGRTASQAQTRGRWFIAVLKPSASGPINLAPVRVEFD